MRFSDEFSFSKTGEDDWFDPVLSIDTKLFIDPFLLYHGQHPDFVGAHEEVIAFFNSVFQLIAQSGGDIRSMAWRQATQTLFFPEVAELCLGYTGAGTGGSGSGSELSGVIASALWEAVKAGLTEIRHFEEVQILREGIGADRISDITACLLRRKLADYTGRVAARHRVPTQEAHYIRGFYDQREGRWLPLHTNLPRNKYNNKPILLVPREFLRTLPTINAEDFWEYCYDFENEVLRQEYSRDVTRHVDKATIIRFAREHPELRVRYVRHREERFSEPYDFARDSQGLVKWYDASAEYVGGHPLALVIASNQDFLDAIRRMANEYKTFVEDNEGWRLLWNDNWTHKREEAAQLVFLGIVKHYCKANNIDVSREADIGRGPVDFKMAIGYSLRALFEVKYAENSRFWHGIEKQLPTYLRAEGVQNGFFVVIVLTDEDLKRLPGINDRTVAVSQKTGFNIEAVVVDARIHPPSASKI